MINLSFDNGTVEQYTLVLSQRDFTHLGALSNVQHIRLKENLNAADELSFEVYKELDGHEERLWDDIYDLRLVWISELNEYYEINVASTDTVYVTKTITAKSLCESELSQTYLNNVEINTATDIARDDYDANYPTVFYRSLENLDTETDEYRIKKNSSLMHRIMEKVPAYSIGHIDQSLWNQQKVFSISNTTLYNFLTGDCASQFNCLFKFDSATRTISAYDLESVCLNDQCSYKQRTGLQYRGFFNDMCPECGSTNIQYYGDDTTVFVSTENLTDEVKFETDVNSMKNCFRLEAGDEDMTAAVINSNPNGTRYIYEFNQETLNDMPEQLRELINSYNKLFERYYNDEPMDLNTDLIPDYNKLCTKYNSDAYHKGVVWKPIPLPPDRIYGYKNLIPYYYNCIDFYSYLKSSMMPDPVEEIYSIEAELENLEAGLSSLNHTFALQSRPQSHDTIVSVITNICQVFVNTGTYKVSVEAGEIYNVHAGDDYWTADIDAVVTLTSYEDEKITDHISYGGLSLTIDYATYMEQNITKLLKRDKDAEDIYDVLTMPWNESTSGSEFRIELAKYSSARLEAFKSSLDAVVGILIEANQGKAEITRTDYNEIHNKSYVLGINPYSEGWYEYNEISKEYKRTTDTFIVDGKSYYKLITSSGFRQIPSYSCYDEAKQICPVCEGWYEDYQTYVTAEKRLTSDLHAIPNKNYYIKNKYNAYTKVKIKAFNPHEYGWFEAVQGKKAAEFLENNNNGDFTLIKFEGKTFYRTPDTVLDYNKTYYQHVTLTNYRLIQLPEIIPKNYNWYEEIWDIGYSQYKYVLTEDTTVNEEKTYYLKNDSVIAAPLYSSFYKPYTAKAEAVERELDTRNVEAQTIGGDSSGNTKGILQYIVERISAVQKTLDFAKYVYDNTFDAIINPTGNPQQQGWYVKRTVDSKYGEYVEYVVTTDTTVDPDKTYYEHNYSYDLYNLYTTYIREDTYNNPNYISTDLTNDQLFENAGIFLETAKEELHKSANYQHSISTNINNLMAIPEFKPLLKKFELGNWIRVKQDDTIYRLRLISYSIDFDNISQLDTEFSDVTVTADGLNDIKSILSQATSMASSYGYTQQQAETGADVMYNYIDDWVANGLNSTLVRINSNTDEDISIDNAGITARTYDDVADGYGNEQLRITHNVLAFTEDNWETVSTALGKIDVTHHEINDNGIGTSTVVKETKYGLAAQAVMSGWVISSNMEAGTIIASHIQNYTNSVYMDFLDPTSSGREYYVKCKDNFTVDKSGNVFVSGRITAAADSQFGPWIVSSTDIHNTGNTMYFGTNGIKITNKFTVSNTGNLYVSGDAEITGKIYADAGSTIGNWIISAGDIHNSSNTMYFGSQGLGIGNNFSVDSVGSLVAESVNLEGIIKANAGYIGAWTLESITSGSYGNGCLYAGTPGSDTGMLLSPNGFTYNAAYAGASANTKWKVMLGKGFGITNAGDVYISGTINASNSYFSGEVHANTGSFNGNISATSGTIGSNNTSNNRWQIGSKSIYNGPTVYNATSTSGTYVGTDGILNSNGTKYVQMHDGKLTANNISLTGGTLAGLTVENGEKGLSFTGEISGTDYYFKISAYGGVTCGSKQNNSWRRMDYVTSYGMLKVDYANATGQYRGFLATAVGNNTYNNPGNNFAYLIADGVHVISDRRSKKEITDLSEELSENIIFNGRPVQFKYKEGENTNYHYGFIAQEMLELLPKSNSIIEHFEESDKYSMNYQELIAPLIKVVQHQQNDINFLKQELIRLKGE